MEDTTTSSANTYELAAPEDASRTYLYGELVIAPAAVVRRFGNGHAGDDGTVTRQWVFRKGDLIFTLYDWKSTSLYDRELRTPTELWARERPFMLRVGSKAPATIEDAEEFSDWLLQETSSEAERPSAAESFVAFDLSSVVSSAADDQQSGDR